jgi:hypothetical protein
MLDEQLRPQQQQQQQQPPQQEQQGQQGQQPRITSTQGPHTAAESISTARAPMQGLCVSLLQKLLGVWRFLAEPDTQGQSASAAASSSSNNNSSSSSQAPAGARASSSNSRSPASAQASNTRSKQLLNVQAACHSVGVILCDALPVEAVDSSADDAWTSRVS